MAHIFSPIGLCLLSDKKKQTQNVNKTLQKNNTSHEYQDKY